MLFHPGTQYSFNLASELQRRGLLAAFHTGLAIRNGSFLGKNCDRLPAWARRRLAKRRLDGFSAEKLRLYPIIELSAMLRRDSASESTMHDRNERFQRAISDLDLKRADVHIGFDTSSWLIARRVKELGGKFVLDQSIGHPLEKERIFKAVRERYPDWSGWLQPKLEAHIRQEQEEHHLADLIVVPSSFARRTLISHGVAPSKIRVVPFGTDLNLFRPVEPRRCSGPIVFLFVGSISARKGSDAA
jgi:glycosyltransferase involved in cell wall biosynthesis